MKSKKNSKSSDEEEFLRWLGGYFDHGAYCDWKMYQRTQTKVLADGAEEDYETETFDVQIKFTGTKGIVDYIEENLRGLRHGKREKNPNSEKGWTITFKGLPEVRALAKLLLPYSKFRKEKLEEVLERVNERIEKGKKWKRYRRMMNRLDFEVGSEDSEKLSI